MRRPAVIALAASAALLVPSTGASAKEITSMKVCGKDGCKRIDLSTAQRFHDLGGLEGSPMSGARAKLGPYYRMVVGLGDDRGHTVGRFATAYLPRERAAIPLDGRPDPHWVKLSDSAARGLRRLTGGLAPIPARRLRATLGSTTADFSGALPPEVRQPWAKASDEDPDGSLPKPLVAGAPAALLLGLGLIWLRRRRI
jgi:MYXO-CTERM domain-containing protein